MKKKSLLLTAVATLGLTVATMAQNVPSYVPTNGLVGWWPFNGNANDESGNGNNGNLVGGVSGTLDRFGNSNSAFLFNGIDGHIEIPSLDNQPYTPITYSAWVIVNSYFPSSFGHKFRSIIGRNTGFVLDNGVIGFYADNNAANGIYDNTFVMWRGGGQSGPAPYSDSIPELNTWLHVAYTQTILGDWSWYLNGVLTNSGNFTDAQNDFNYFQIGGCNNSTGNFFWNDKLDDIGLWSRALTQQEIADLYNGCQQSVNTQPSNQQININNTAQFIVGSTDPGATYQWQTDLGIGFQNLNSVGQYSGTTNDTLTVSNVTLSNNNQPFRCIISSGSCSDTSNVAVLTVNNNVGINEFAQDNLFSVYPNPAQTVINIKADSKLIGEQYTIIDNAGRIVLSGKIVTENTSIELGSLSNGIYLFQVKDNLNQSFRIIKN
jgi:Concanavalin A-like lectin/glucanases superfamily/Secretion system C-terminal sorting domain